MNVDPQEMILSTFFGRRAGVRTFTGMVQSSPLRRVVLAPLIEEPIRMATHTTLRSPATIATAALFLVVGPTVADQPASSLHPSTPDAIRLGFTPEVAAALDLTGQQAGRVLDAMADAETERAAVTRAELALRDAEQRVAEAHRAIQWPASRSEADQAVRDLAAARSAVASATSELEAARRGLLEAALVPGSQAELAAELVFPASWARKLPAEYRVLDLDRATASRLAAAVREERAAALDDRAPADWAVSVLSTTRANSEVAELRGRVLRSLDAVAAAFGIGTGQR